MALREGRLLARPLLHDVGGYAAGERIDTRAMRVLDTGRDFRPGVGPVPYTDNHDHSTLINRVGGRARWWATQPAAIALFTCSGGPLLRNGAEFGDDQHLPSAGPGRVQPRPLNWELAEDSIGESLRTLYRHLCAIRAAHPALRSPNFHPRYYDERWEHFDHDGYGVDTARGLAVYHRWGEDDNGHLERFIIALSFTGTDHTVDLPFSADGRWEDLLTGDVVEVRDTLIRAHRIPSHWGRVYWHTDCRARACTRTPLKTVPLETFAPDTATTGSDRRHHFRRSCRYAADSRARAR